jgi:hypothetical protein
MVADAVTLARALRRSLSQELNGSSTTVMITSQTRTSEQRRLGHASMRVTEKHYSPWVWSRQGLLERAVSKIHASGEIEARYNSGTIFRGLF